MGNVEFIEFAEKVFRSDWIKPQEKAMLATAIAIASALTGINQSLCEIHDILRGGFSTLDGALSVRNV